MSSDARSLGSQPIRLQENSRDRLSTNQIAAGAIIGNGDRKS